MATKQNTKRVSESKIKRSKSVRATPAKTPAGLAPITPADPPRPAKPKTTVTLSKVQAEDLANEAVRLGMMASAVRRLSWMVEDADQETQCAGSVALEAISILGAFSADYIVRAVGGYGVGNYHDELEKYAGAAGFKREARHE